MNPRVWLEQIFPDRKSSPPTDWLFLIFHRTADLQSVLEKWDAPSSALWMTDQRVVYIYVRGKVKDSPVEEVTARVPIRSLRYIKIYVLTRFGDGTRCSDVIEMHWSGGWSLKATVDYHFKLVSVFTVNSSVWFYVITCKVETSPD